MSHATKPGTSTPLRRPATTAPRAPVVTPKRKTTRQAQDTRVTIPTTMSAKTDQKRPQTKPKQTESKLNERHERFAENMVLNGGQKSKAARDAGYVTSNAASTGNHLARNPQIQKLIEKRRAQMAAAANITRQEIIGGFVEMAQFALPDVVGRDGTISLRKAKRLGLEHLIKEITVVERHSKDGSCRISKTYKAYSRQDALDSLTEIFGLKKLAARNPLEVARETYGMMRPKSNYADIPDEVLAQMVAERFNVGAADILNAGNP